MCMRRYIMNMYEYIINMYVKIYYKYCITKNTLTLYTEQKHILDSAFHFASNTSTCNKVAVGACFSGYGNIKEYSSNYSSDYDCKSNKNCYKAAVTGIYESCEETRKYCKATHAEINMINILKSKNIDPSCGVLYITRYPCLNCARSCAEFGFKNIVYCGKQEISDDVKKIFDDYNINVCWIPDIDYE